MRNKAVKRATKGQDKGGARRIINEAIKKRKKINTQLPRSKEERGIFWNEIRLTEEKYNSSYNNRSKYSLFVC